MVKNFLLYVTLFGQISFKNGSVKIFVSKHFRLLAKFLSIFVAEVFTGKVSQTSIPSLTEYYIHQTLIVRNTSPKLVNWVNFCKWILFQIKKKPLKNQNFHSQICLSNLDLKKIPRNSWKIGNSLFGDSQWNWSSHVIFKVKSTTIPVNKHRLKSKTFLNILTLNIFHIFFFLGGGGGGGIFSVAILKRVFVSWDEKLSTREVSMHQLFVMKP